MSSYYLDFFVISGNSTAALVSPLFDPISDPVSHLPRVGDSFHIDGEFYSVVAVLSEYSRIVDSDLPLSFDIYLRKIGNQSDFNASLLS